MRGWADRYRKARTDDVPTVERLGAWLEANRPAESGATLVHNDFKYDNVVLAPDLSGVTAVLDWEMATIGDPLMDLGTALGYWIDADDRADVPGRSVFGPTNRPGNLTRLQFVERWSRATGRDASNVRFLLCVRALQARRHLAAALQALRRRAHEGRALRAHARRACGRSRPRPSSRSTRGASIAWRSRSPDLGLRRAAGPRAATARSRPSARARP